VLVKTYISSSKASVVVGGALAAPRAFQRVIGAPSTSNWGISKVSPQRFPALEAADRSAGKIERAFLLLVQVVKDRIVLKDLAEKLEQGDLTGAEQLVDVENAMEQAALGKGVPVGEPGLQDALQIAFHAGAKAELEALADVPIEKAAKKPRLGAELSLNLLNPEAVAFLQGYTMNLIRQVSLQTRLAIRDVILTAFNEGGHPYEQAREIRNLIGLTQSQAAAVRRFRQMLQSGDPAKMREVLERTLRDHRFDSTVMRAIQVQTTIPKEKVVTMVDRYYQRYLTYRAQTIARTESIRASCAGQQELWRQAQQQQLLDPERTRRKWIITPDDRLCEYCKAIRALNPDGVRLDEEFVTEDGSVDQPPAHPRCRCAFGLFFPEREKRRAARRAAREAQEKKGEV